MTRREVLIARSVVYAILTSLPTGEPARNRSLLCRALRIFRLFSLTFRLLRPDLFRALRGVWEIEENGYRASFGAESTTNNEESSSGSWKQRKRNKGRHVLQSMGDMGYSGSTFFCTIDGAYVVKSIPRQFEHDFFKNELLLPYAEHMQKNPASLLIRITDFLERTHKSIGELLGLAPSHHIVMENILYGQNHQASEGREESKWESWDLKPMSFFYPERDVAGGVLATEATKSKLADEFDGKLKLTTSQAAELREQLEKDTRFLEENNAVDYSLFLVRISATGDASDPESPTHSGPDQEGDRLLPPTRPPPFSSRNPPTWRTGIPSRDGKEVYRAAVLDFFWAKHTFRAKVMTGLVRGYNLIDEQGPMSITAESQEYRERFLEMCGEFIDASD